MADEFTDEAHEAIQQAIRRAEVSQDLHGELRRQHPDLPEAFEDVLKVLTRPTRRRSRYVQGWRA